jgi:hypothetical protein
MLSGASIKILPFNTLTAYLSAKVSAKFKSQYEN